MLPVNKSDIDVSEVSSNESESEAESSDDVDDTLNFLNAQWGSTLTDFNVPPFIESSGPLHSLPVNATALDYFELLFTPDVFETLVLETNRYANQVAATRGSPDPLWKPIMEVQEMRAFIALNIIMGIKQLPRLWFYWSTDARYDDPYVSSIMTKSRFEKICQYLHVRDTSNQPRRGEPGYDPLYKVTSARFCV